MKFGKEFSSQMVPEWQEAYMDYNHLKSLLKEIQRFKLRTNPPSAAQGPQLKRKMTLYRAFSGLTQKYHSLKSASSRGGDVEDQVILVKSVPQEGSSDEGCYQTNFLMPGDEGGEYELVYFRRLDDELNKVNRFYKSKVEEVRKEADMLDKQMNALIAFRIKVDNPAYLQSADMNQLASDVATSAAAVTASTPSEATRATVRHMEAIQEVELSNRGMSEEGCSQETEMNGSNTSTHTATAVDVIRENNNPNGGIKVMSRPAPLEVLNRVRINNTLETPRSTLKGIFRFSNGTQLNFRKKDLSKVEEQLKRAFVEFYQKLRLLKSYSFLNILGFSKIMKKYDKMIGRNASKAYLKVVDDSYIGNSDEATRLMERVEAAFIKHFSNSNRSKGINVLRPKAKADRHRVTFFTGLFAGCAIALIVAVVVIVRLRRLLEKKGSTQYMDNLFPLYSLFGFIVLHMLMFGGNIYFWRRYRVNYGFIFGFKQGTELGFREVFLLSTGLAVLALGTVISNLDMEMDPRTKSFGQYSELLPLGLVILLLAIIFCPWNIIYRSNRFFILQCLFHCICAPLYKVTLPDFFMADQLTSQVQAIRSLQYYICYYGWGNYKERHKCNQTGLYKTFLYIVAVIPYSWRCLQCLRRLYEEKDRMQGYNALKYFSTIVAVVMRTAYSMSQKRGWTGRRVMAVATSIISALVSTYWDLVFDWGLLQRHSKNPWLRDKLLVSQDAVYFAAMISNVLLRFAWLQTVVPLEVPFLHKEALVAIFACLEIIRRGIWNFFRLENEHLNNVGKYRAFKSVPLPFSYDEDDDKDE